MNEQQSKLAKGKLLQILTYVREVNKLRTPPVSDSGKYDWSIRYSSLPKYHTVYTTSALGLSVFDGTLLRVSRPLETKCPTPPDAIVEWLQNGWDEIDEEAEVTEAINSNDDDGHTITIRFDESLARRGAFNEWILRRNAWRIAERPAREAAKLFADLFKLHAQLQRDGEKYQLYIGDGHLVWASGIEPVNHPVLLKKIELEFDPSVPEFTMRETDDTTELYTSLLRHHELDGKAVADAKEQLELEERHPLESAKTTEFLEFLVQRFFESGKFVEGKGDMKAGTPSIYRDPVIFLGSRSQGFSEALDKLIDGIDLFEQLPEALLRIVGIDSKDSAETGQGNTSSDTEASVAVDKPKIDFLLTKPANREQERVIERLEETGSVLVQGPPGTGKSHTIANIIGHLLASGKTVLVASQTAKALRVVREKVVGPLQPLCVSVLDNDTQSKSELEESVNGIISYLSRTDIASLTREITQLEDRRSQVKLQIEELQAKSLEIRKSEYTDIVVAGEGKAPSEAARLVAEQEELHGWIPGKIEYGAPVPLSDEEFAELYSSNIGISSIEEQCLSEGLPEFERVLKPIGLQELAQRVGSVDKDKASQFQHVWNGTDQKPEQLDSIASELKKGLEVFKGQEWIKKIAEDSKLGNERLQPWLTLINLIESSVGEVATRSEIIIRNGPKVADLNSSEAKQTCDEIIKHLKAGGNFGFFATAFKSHWKAFLTSCSVDDGTPKTVEHFEAISALIETAKIRSDLTKRWDRQIVAIGGPALVGAESELRALTLVNALQTATKWAPTIWAPVEASLTAERFNMAAAWILLPIANGQSNHIDRIQLFAETTVLPALESRMLWLRLRNLEIERERTLHVLKGHLTKRANASAYMHSMVQAVELFDVGKYETAYTTYMQIRMKHEPHQCRIHLLERLKHSAPQWAVEIEKRNGIHGNASAPKKIALAWTVCQWRQELDRRLGHDFAAVQRDLHKAKSELNAVNAAYVEKLAWRFQHQRTGLKEKQALTGWQQLQNKITKTGRGKRDLHLKREARNTLKNCKNAVPVWIMPLSRVFDSFDLVQTKFDVILLDEASQSDISALVAFAIAKQVIVVGDNEQVTPQAVGQELSKVQALIEEYLQGIPNKMLYDGKTSVYDLADQAFGGVIRLVEHFRCVPNIIEFSNRLSYNGEIKALREASSSPYDSHLIAHRVEGATSPDKKNKKEATEVASIIAAMTEMSEYTKASIGAISMLGQDQAILIDTILQKHLSANTISRHKLLSGNSSQFQGDERDVIVISMVDACEAPPLSIRQTEDFKKAFNVAASRARNQMWVVHSLNPNTDLKPGDLRLRLIQHAENPAALADQIEATQKKADSKSVVFEPMVIKDLMNEGFRVVPQFDVGAYTIDMIVEGESKRIAIECDGDRYHPQEKLADDIQRQMVLERLGWRFIRIRGSEYFRNPKSTMKRVFVELDALNVERLGPKNVEAVRVGEDPLKQKVLRRAFELREEWLKTEVAEEPVAQKRGRWGKKKAETSILRVESSRAVGNLAVAQSLSVNPVASEVQIPEEIRRRFTAPDHMIASEMSTVASVFHQIDIEHLPQTLIAHNFQIVDKRAVGGCLWVIDEPRFAEVAGLLAKSSIQFLFAENGSGSTGARPAWYIKAKSIS